MRARKSSKIESSTVRRTLCGVGAEMGAGTISRRRARCVKGANACKIMSVWRVPRTNNTLGDQPAGPDTVCEPVLCMANERVSNHSCVSCGPGSVNDAGDDASGSDTQCDAILCDIHEHAVNHNCVECPPGSENQAGDDSSGADTMCDAILCAVNHHVVNNACVACPDGHTTRGRRLHAQRTLRAPKSRAAPTNAW